MLSIGQFKDLMAGFQSLVTAVGIVVAGLWAYFNYFRKRESHPKVEISHTITTQALNHDYLLLSVEMDCLNIGSVQVPLRAAETQVYQVAPSTDDDITAMVQIQNDDDRRDLHFRWTGLGRCRHEWQDQVSTLNPGEREHIVFDFLVYRRDIEAIYVYSFLLKRSLSLDAREIEMGWNRRTLFKFPKPSMSEVLSHENTQGR